MTVEDAARILHRQLTVGGYSPSWEQANPSLRQRLRAAAGELLARMEDQR